MPTVAEPTGNPMSIPPGTIEPVPTVTTAPPVSSSATGISEDTDPCTLLSTTEIAAAVGYEVLPGARTDAGRPHCTFASGTPGNADLTVGIGGFDYNDDLNGADEFAAQVLRLSPSDGLASDVEAYIAWGSHDDPNLPIPIMELHDSQDASQSPMSVTFPNSTASTDDQVQALKLLAIALSARYRPV